MKNGSQWLPLSNFWPMPPKVELRTCSKQNIYGADVVKAALDELFYGKCGYCEFKLIRTDQNVDHYRPKGRVAEATKHRGYYWLAYEWDQPDTFLYAL